MTASCDPIKLTHNRYYIDFNMRMLNKYVWRFLGTQLPNERIEVSRLYFERKYGGVPPPAGYDLRFTISAQQLGIPMLRQHDALNDALMSAMIYRQLRDMRECGSRLRRSHTTVPPPIAA